MLLRDGPLDLVAVVPVVRQGCMHIGEGDGWMVMDDLIRGHAQLFVPDRYVLHPDAVTRDARLWPAHPVDDLNMLTYHISHGTALAPDTETAAGQRRPA